MDEGANGWNGSRSDGTHADEAGSSAPDVAESPDQIGQPASGRDERQADSPPDQAHDAAECAPPAVINGDHGQGVSPAVPGATPQLPDEPAPVEIRDPGAPARRRRSVDRRAGGTLAPGDSRRRPHVFQAYGVCHFLSTSRIPRLLSALVDRCLADDVRLDHVLIHGAPGSGTSLLAQALLNDFAPPRVVEIDAAFGCDSELVRRSIQDVGPKGVLYIRHIDALDAECESVLANALGDRSVRFKRRGPPGLVDPSETDLDRAIAASANDAPDAVDGEAPDFTLVATAHLMTHVGYMLRTRFQHLFHLRNDPKALRNVVLRALRRNGPIRLEADCFPQLERVLATLSDSCEPIVQTVLLRAESEGLASLGAEEMRTVLEEDLAARIPDEAYSASLRRHLVGRKIEAITADEVRRIAEETGWGLMAAEAALSMMAIEEARSRHPRRPPS